MKRRFIAGAVCPRCGLIDKVVMLLDSDDRQRECVSCGYTDKLDGEAEISEPATRVNQPRVDQPVLEHEEEIQTIRILLDNENPESSK